MMRKRWLHGLLRDCVDGFDDADASARLQDFQAKHHHLDQDHLVRRWLEHRLRETGLVYGTPLASEEAIASKSQDHHLQRRSVFLAIIRIEAQLAMEVGCAVHHCSQGDRRIAELILCFALLCRRFRLAEKIHNLIKSIDNGVDVSAKLIRFSARVAKTLPKHIYITGNPLLGLPIHNSFNYVDAKTLGRIAVSYFEHERIDRTSIERIRAYANHEKDLLLRAMVGLTLADRNLDKDSFRIVALQIKSAKLQRKVRRHLLRLLSRKSPLRFGTNTIRHNRIPDFLLEQVVLGAMLDGHYSEKESIYIGDLAGWLGTSAEKLAQLEAQVLEFYEKHKAYLDIFTVGEAVTTHRRLMLGRLQNAIIENVSLIMQEIRNTSGLAELLYRASRGDKLSKEERRCMGQQLVGILRTIPSLAIFSLPGGALLLPLLYKVLPNGMKPRAFAERDRLRREKEQDEIF